MTKYALAAAILLSSALTAHADECGNTTLPEGAVPYTKAQASHAFSGKTWLWDDGGAYFSPKGKFVAISGSHKSYGKGTWSASDDGKVCYDADWKSPTGNGPYSDCRALVKTKDRQYDSSTNGDDKGKWWCSEASRQGLFSKLKPGDKITPKLATFIKENAIQ
jgi:hypothetical protein